MPPVEIPVHTDRLGRVLNIGDVVAVPRSATTIDIGEVAKLNPKLIGVKVFSNHNGYKRNYNKRPEEMIKLEEKYVTKWLLSRQ
jgi:hypothetical protein